jgi:hypothetical protein
MEWYLVKQETRLHEWCLVKQEIRLRGLVLI